MDKIKVDGLSIAFEQKGKGSPLVLLHGALSDSRMWHRQIDALSDEFTLVAWDAPGCGNSEDPPKSFSLSDFADSLAGLIEVLNLENPHVIGLSFGGGLALELYHRHPEIPKSLVLASAYAGWAGSLPPEEVEERVKQGLKQSDWPTERVVEKWIPSLFPESAPKDVVKETARIMADFHPVGMRAMLTAFAESNLYEILTTIEVPTLLLYGEEDQRSPLEIAKEMEDKIPTSKLVTIPDAGHMISSETPAIFNSEVRDFLRAI